MKKAALSSVYRSADVGKACTTILDMGFDCVEVMAYPPHTDLNNIAMTADALSPFEGSISGFGIYENLADFRNPQRMEAVQKTISCIELCSKVGGVFVVCQTGVFPSFLRKEAQALFEESIQTLLPVLHRYGVKLALENAQNTLLSTVEDVLSFLHTHPDEEICLTVDPVNLFESKSALTEALCPRTINVHVKNVANGKEAPLDKGDVDFLGVLSLPWNCIFSVEYGETAEPDVFLRTALDFLRCHHETDSHRSSKNG